MPKKPEIIHIVAPDVDNSAAELKILDDLDDRRAEKLDDVVQERREYVQARRKLREQRDGL